MSYTTMMGILENGEVECFDEYKNGHGSGPYIWHALFIRRGISSYQSFPIDSYDPERPKSGYLGLLGNSLISSDYLTQCCEPEAWALAMTFDNCVITRDVAPEAVRWLKSFLENIPPWVAPNSVNHWPKIVALLENMPEKYTGLAINHTSCGDCEMYSGIYDEETEECTPYNIKKDSGHFMLSAALVRTWMRGDG